MSGEPVIDIYCHWLPPRLRRAIEGLGGAYVHMFARAANLPLMSDLDARFRAMDLLPGYRQVPSLCAPPLETLARAQATEMARRANDEMAEIVRAHPDRLAGFVAALPLNDPDACFEEMHRACVQLGAAGVQMYTNIAGAPPDRPWCLDLLQEADAIGAGVWLHPIRNPAHADYPEENVSHHELWWALGWPHETSVAMARWTFAGVFDRAPRLRVLTHHGGGTVPMLAGRFAAGLRRMGERTGSASAMPALSEPVDQVLRRFYADTASFGYAPTIECALAFFGADRILFGSDMPFGSPDGWGQVPITLSLLEGLLGDEPVLRRKILNDNALDWLKPRPQVTVTVRATSAYRKIAEVPI